MRVNFGGFDILMTELLLHGADIRARFQQVRGKGMPQRMTVHVLFDTSLLRGQFDRAINIRENDDAEITLTNAGVCLTQKPDLIKAEEYFREALEFKSSYGEALLQMTLLKYQTEDYMSARAFMQRYRSANPPNAGILYLCVLIEDKMGDERARLECSNELLRDFPNSEESRRILEN